MGLGLESFEVFNTGRRNNICQKQESDLGLLIHVDYWEIQFDEWELVDCGRSYYSRLPLSLTAYFLLPQLGAPDEYVEAERA